MNNGDKTGRFIKTMGRLVSVTCGPHVTLKSDLQTLRMFTVLIWRFGENLYQKLETTKDCSSNMIAT